MVIPEIKINLERDLVSITRKRLIEIGYDKASIEAFEAKHSEDKALWLLDAFHKAHRRIVSEVPREVHKARTFSVPPDHFVALSTIEEKIKNGDTIVPYLHKPIEELDFDDWLLND